MKTNRLIYKMLCLSLAIATVVLLSGCSPKEYRLDTSFLEFGSPPSTEPSFIPDEPAPPQQRALISFAGDCTFSNIQGLSDFNYVYNSEGPEYFLSGVAEIFANDDLTIVNLEGPLTNSTAQIEKTDSPNYWFRSPPEYVQILTYGSVEVCNLANNHNIDYGYAGFEETKEVLNNAGIDYFAYSETLVREVNGIRIGFFGLAFDSSPGNIYSAMDRLWSDGAEAIIAYFHDGIESQYYPSENQIAAAYTAIDYGASAVIMSHPHVIQGTEEYNGGFIAYSLGNFCYGGHTNPNDKDSMIVQLEFVRTDTGITCIPKVIPCSITSTPGRNDYRPVVLSGEEGQRVLDKIAEYSG